MSDPQQPDIQDEISQSTISKDIYCPGCRYHLFGIISDRCPECGYSLSYLTCETSSIPWENRREIGRVKAYCQTVWFMFFRRQRFAEQYAKTVIYRDARIFQLVTIGLVFVPIVIVAIVFSTTIISEIQQSNTSNNPLPFPTMNTNPVIWELLYKEVWPMMLLLGCIFLCLLSVTGIASYFFHPKELSIHRQNNAIALSYYTCAPLPALMISLIVIGSLYWNEVFTGWGLYTFIVLSSVLLIVSFANWVDSAPLLHHIIIPQLNRRMGLRIVLPIFWLLLGGLILVVLPVLIMYILVGVTSLR